MSIDAGAIPVLSPIQRGEDMKTEVFHDGKICRNQPAQIKGHRHNKILISFSLDGENITRWFKRISRKHGGKYECDGYNFYYCQRMTKMRGKLGYNNAKD